jgi:polar amino acid transport system substrate-binding protein
MRKFCLVLSFIATTASLAPATAATMEFYTIEAPPLTMVKGDRHGILGDILMEALRRAGHEINLVEAPWRHAQQVVADGEDLLIIFARTAEREPHYTWIADIYTLERTFATKQRKAMIVVGQGTPQEALLLQEGVDPGYLVRLPVEGNEVELLARGRIDAWFNSSTETLWKWRNSGKFERIVLGKVITSDEMYVACSKKCSPDVVQAIAKAVESMKQDGTVEKIVHSYLRGESGSRK